MTFKCKIGLHSWDGCKCSECSKTKDVGHDWSKDCEKCSKCGQTRDNQHDYSKDCEKCSKCGKSRDNQHDWSKDSEKCSNCGLERHDWNGCKCSKCGKTRDSQHQWKDNKCSICGLAKTEGLLPGEVVPINGLYHCSICMYEAMGNYAVAMYKENERALEQARIAVNILKKNFSAGSIFNECPKHKTFMSWELEK
ncbi:MAG: hypothetical protein ACOYLO_14615 [Ferruginibacter sp.]